MFSTFLPILMLSALCISVNAKFSLFETELNNILDVQDCLTDLQIADTNSQEFQTCKEVVKVKVYYETLCPDCISFDTKDLRQVIMKLGHHVKIKTYPYGNAKTQIDDKGKVTIVCQHGNGECYGNKLHACALDLITNHTAAILYNICMMEPSENSRGSDDEAADRCTTIIPANSKAIKACAKSEKGFKLLKHYGDETLKVHPNYVPYVLVNGKLYDEDKNPDFFTFLCHQFKAPPSECAVKLLEFDSHLGYYTNKV